MYVRYMPCDSYKASIKKFNTKDRSENVEPEHCPFPRVKAFACSKVKKRATTKTPRKCI